MRSLRDVGSEEGRPLVFGGPSLSRVPQSWLSRCEVRPPARRDDLFALLDRPAATVVLVDGLFGGSMAVTPLECAQLISRGWTVVGAGSIGALRASELWQTGMIGVGTIYQLMRLGEIDADTDVAVSYDPDTWSEISVSIVQLRALLGALPHGLASPPIDELLESARSIYWLERSWSHVWQAWARIGMTSDTLNRAKFLASDDRIHPKKRDAVEAIRLVTATRWIKFLDEEVSWLTDRSL
ncbi:TfuA-like protein [Piscinibacter gummiphilus]|uniref:TfuA-like protein n=1 Tax=Piscinibacter gummiphilus TaxID=946333 RepID=A0ABZ0D278_9BURK|nr:TfuA-like protein [Piscinibacter gummiphilus]WOB11350.1 TfuA-like protein [Piscinibacter gummiphilus]